MSVTKIYVYARNINRATADVAQGRGYFVAGAIPAHMRGAGTYLYEVELRAKRIRKGKRP